MPTDRDHLILDAPAVEVVLAVVAVALVAVLLAELATAPNRALQESAVVCSDQFADRSAAAEAAQATAHPLHRMTDGAPPNQGVAPSLMTPLAVTTVAVPAAAHTSAVHTSAVPTAPDRV